MYKMSRCQEANVCLLKGDERNGDAKMLEEKLTKAR